MSQDMERPRRWEPGALKVQAGGPDTMSLAEGRDTTADQLSIDDALEEGRRRRDRGHEVAVWATDVQWREAFDAAVVRWATKGVEFVSDDVIAEVGLPVAPSANSIGARMGAAARRGVIRKVGYRTSTRPSRHASVVAVWIGAEVAR